MSFLGHAIPSMTLGPAKGYETGGKYNKYNNNQPTTIMEGNTYHHHNHASYNNEKMIISLERLFDVYQIYLKIFIIHFGIIL